MAQTTKVPTAASTSGGWNDPEDALILGSGVAEAVGNGWLRLTDCFPLIPTGDEVVGIRVEIFGASVTPTVYQRDTFTGTGYLRYHVGETNATWENLYTINAPNENILDSGRVYRSLSNIFYGSTHFFNGGEHFIPSYTVPVADYRVVAKFYGWASDDPPVPPVDPGPGPGPIGPPDPGDDGSWVVGGYTSQARILARVRPTNNWYALAYNAGTGYGGTWTLEKGAYPSADVVLATWPDTIAPGDFKTGVLEVEGSAIRAYIDGVLRMSATDTSYTTAGYTGLRFDGPPNAVGLDDYMTTGVAPIGAYEIALTIDGLTPWGEIRSADPDPDGMIYLGDSSDMWGTTLSDSEANGPNFGLLIRRAGTGSRTVDAARVIIYHVAPGGTFDMAENQTVKRRIHFAPETTYGTAVPTTRRMMWATVNPAIEAEWKEHRPQGNKLVQEEMLMREHSVSPLTGSPDFEELPYWAQGAIAAAATTGSGVKDTPHRHEMAFDNQGETAPISYTFEVGSKASRASRVKGAVINEFGLSFGRSGTSTAELSGNMFGQAIEDGVSMSGGISAVNTLVLTATGGTFYILFKGKKSAAITVAGLTTGALATAINGISTISAGGGSVTVTSPVGGTFVISIVAGAAAGIAVPRMELTRDSVLTGGTAVFSLTTPGGYAEYDGKPILPGMVKVYMADTYEGLDAAKLTRAHLAGFAITDRWGPYWVLGGEGAADFVNVIELPVSARFNLELQADSNGMALLGTARADNPLRYIRIEALGGNIGVSSTRHRMTLEAAVKIAALGNFEDNDGIFQTNYELASVEDSDATGLSFRMVVENGVPTYATA